jgi:peptidoglycan hydrolase-like protein with peptidoglycan-binding domain
MNREQVKSAQQALRDKGHDPGAIDGVMGPKTQAALKDFQKAQGLNETGRLDAETMAKLGVDSTSPSASPRTAPGAAPRPEGGAAKDKQPAGKPQTR